MEGASFDAPFFHACYSARARTLHANEVLKTNVQNLRLKQTTLLPITAFMIFLALIGSLIIAGELAHQLRQIRLRRLLRAQKNRLIL